MMVCTAVLIGRIQRGVRALSSPCRNVYLVENVDTEPAIVKSISALLKVSPPQVLEAEKFGAPCVRRRLVWANFGWPEEPVTRCGPNLLLA